MDKQYQSDINVFILNECPNNLSKVIDIEKGAMLIDTESTSKYDILISIKFVLQNKNQK